MNVSAFFRPRVLGGVLAILLLTGCRTYGEYNNEALTVEQINETNRLFAETLDRARGDLSSLQQAGSGKAMMQRGVDHFATAVLMHEVMLEDHLRLATEVDEDDYRDVHRLYGAIISEQNIIQERYDHILSGLTALSDTTEAKMPTLESFYQVAPQFYERMMAANRRVTARQVVGRSGMMKPMMNEADSLGMDAPTPQATEAFPPVPEPVDEAEANESEDQ